MILRVKRIFKGDTYTIGKLYVNDEYFCDTLEDKVRDLNTEKKVYGETAIPEGTYNVILSWSPKFNRILPRLENVPYFDGILIHSGNTKEDTCGCILVGENKVKGKVINSRQYEKKLFQLLYDTSSNPNEDIKIIIEN